MTEFAYLSGGWGGADDRLWPGPEAVANFGEKRGGMEI